VKEVKRRAGGGRCLFKKPLLLGIQNEKKNHKEKTRQQGVGMQEKKKRIKRVLENVQ